MNLGSKSAFFALILAFGVAACSKADAPDTSEVTVTSSKLTPFDQSNSKQDVRISADVRQALMKDGTLSVDAKNIKIITRDGVVTLRGAVKTEAERANIDFAATNTPGAIRVDDQLTLETSSPQPKASDELH